MLVIIKESRVFALLSEPGNPISLVLIPLSGLLCLLPATEWAASAIRADGPVAEQLAEYIAKHNIHKVTFLYAGGLNSDTTNWYSGKVQRSVTFDNEGLSYTDKKGASLVLRQKLRINNLVITRSHNVNGFPSDNLQEFVNSEIARGISGSNAKPYRIGNYLIWSL